MQGWLYCVGKTLRSFGDVGAYYLDSFVGLAGYVSRFVFLTGWTDIFCIIQVVSGE